jgi:hypothetical protein
VCRSIGHSCPRRRHIFSVFFSHGASGGKWSKCKRSPILCVRQRDSHWDQEGAYFTRLNCEELDFETWEPLGLNQNQPPQGQPLLWCAWRLAENRMTLSSDGQNHELYYCSAWLQYLIEHFFTPWDYTLQGVIAWQGDDAEDRGTIVVKNSQIEHRLFQLSGESKRVWPDQPIACVHQNALETKLLCAHQQPGQRTRH